MTLKRNSGPMKRKRKSSKFLTVEDEPIRRGKIHFADPNRIGWSLCGLSIHNLTPFGDDVTCKFCQKRLRKTGKL